MDSALATWDARPSHRAGSTADATLALHLTMPRPKCLLEVAHTCQNDDPWADSSLYAFCCDGVQIGFVTPAVWEVLREQGPAQHWPLVLHTAQRAVTFTDACSSVEQRTHAMNAIAEWMRDQRLFPDPLDGTW